jgi:hypothetical protein
MLPTTFLRLTARVTIEPSGPRTTGPREYSIKVMLNLSPVEPKYADRGYVGGVARRALAGFSPAGGELDRHAFSEVLASTNGKAGAVATEVVGVEGSVVWPEKPAIGSVEQLRDVLLAEGYRVAAREVRECAEPRCAAEALVDWNSPSAVPAGWFSSVVCGKHNYRACSACKSTYVMTSTSSVGQAPSVHCGVCGVVLIEWGSSKVWNADLVTRGEAR